MKTKLAKTTDLMEYLAKTEGDTLHRNPTERHPTSAYGIYKKYHGQAKIWGFYKKVCSDNRIPCDASNKSNRDRINAVIAKDDDLKEQEKDLAYDFYHNDFMNPALSVLSDSDFLAVFSMSAVMGQNRAVKILQSSLTLVEDGIIGKNTIGALEDFDRNDFLDLSQDHFDGLAKRNSRAYGRYINGWTDRVDYLRESAVKKVEAKKEIKKEIKNESISTKEDLSN